jgi:hypothetical protein
MPPRSNVVPFHRQLPAEPSSDLKHELQDRLWREERHAYSTGSRQAYRHDPIDLTKEAIKAWRRATLLTWVVMWSWWR